MTTNEPRDPHREKMDLVIAERIRELRLGLKGERAHSWRRIAELVTGDPDQMTGSTLCRLAQEALDEEWHDD